MYKWRCACATDDLPKGQLPRLIDEAKRKQAVRAEAEKKRNEEKKSDAK
jgi:hypothetical protein